MLKERLKKRKNNLKKKKKKKTCSLSLQAETL